MLMKAIETVYAGYRFRSRLEARWAVFFDTLGISYRYEFEGYDLDGVWYLPDFYLPQYDCFIEIKGQQPTTEERRKAFLLALHTGKPTYTFAGDIWLPQESGGYQGFGDIPPRCLAIDEVDNDQPVYLPIRTSPAFVDAIRYLNVKNRIKFDFVYNSHQKLTLGISGSAFSDDRECVAERVAAQIAQLKVQQQALEALLPLLEEIEQQLILIVEDKSEASLTYDLLPYRYLERVVWLQDTTTNTIVPGVIAQLPFIRAKHTNGVWAAPINIQSWWVYTELIAQTLQSERLLKAYTAARQARFE